MTKSELRKIYLARQKGLSAAERENKSRQVSDLFFAHFDLANIRLLHCFLPIEKFNEINTRLIFERVWREFPHVETLAPRVDFQTGEMENLKFTPQTNLIKNQWMIDEPTHDQTVESAKIDAVLVPLLCFDFWGFRVGYGKGFYDKFLAKCRADCLKIGLSFFPPVEKTADVNEFDVKLNFCITAEKIWKFGLN